jgi:hypothetical protein
MADQEMAPKSERVVYLLRADKSEWSVRRRQSVVKKEHYSLTTRLPHLICSCFTGGGGLWGLSALAQP